MSFFDLFRRNPKPQAWRVPPSKEYAELLDKTRLKKLERDMAKADADIERLKDDQDLQAVKMRAERARFEAREARAKAEIAELRDSYEDDDEQDDDEQDDDGAELTPEAIIAGVMKDVLKGSRGSEGQAGQDRTTINLASGDSAERPRVSAGTAQKALPPEG